MTDETDAERRRALAERAETDLERWGTPDALMAAWDGRAKIAADFIPRIAAALTARGIRPPSGGECWHASQVRRILLAAARAPER